MAQSDNGPLWLLARTYAHGTIHDGDLGYITTLLAAPHVRLASPAGYRLLSGRYMVSYLQGVGHTIMVSVLYSPCAWIGCYPISCWYHWNRARADIGTGLHMLVHIVPNLETMMLYAQDVIP